MFEGARFTQCGFLSMKASVIVPAFNEGESLKECLRSICGQAFENFEVILVDNASTDQTKSVCRSFPVKYIYFDAKKSSYAARNEGVRNALGDVLVFLDADLTFVPSFLSELLSEYNADDDKRVFVGAVVDDPRVPEYLREMTPVNQEGLEELDPRKIATAAVAVPRRLFEALGGFDEELLSGGDFDFFSRAKDAFNPKVFHAPGAIAYHYWGSTLNDFLLREERYAFGASLRAKKANRPPPGLISHFVDAAKVGAMKLPAMALVPFRRKREAWLDCWKNQVAHFFGKIWFCKGLIKYRLG
jgi:glycosyltransferase involved in cell wall biosynthesis